MPKVKQYVWTHKELAEQLVKAQGIREGHWGLYMEFGTKGTNVGISPGQMMPAAIVLINSIGIQRFDEPNGLTVDAAEVNPKSN